MPKPFRRLIERLPAERRARIEAQKQALLEERKSREWGRQAHSRRTTAER